MDTQEQAFKVRTYGFSELAQCYCPEISRESAANRLRLWIRQSASLQEKLKEGGYRFGHKVLTPRQVSILVEHLGEP